MVKIKNIQVKFMGWKKNYMQNFWVCVFFWLLKYHRKPKITKMKCYMQNFWADNKVTSKILLQKPQSLKSLYLLYK
jgi:hypothetical protein